jgi:hypothetical protein
MSHSTVTPAPHFRATLGEPLDVRVIFPNGDSDYIARVKHVWGRADNNGVTFRSVTGEAFTTTYRDANFMAYRGDSTVDSRSRDWHLLNMAVSFFHHGEVGMPMWERELIYVKSA